MTIDAECGIKSRVLSSGASRIKMRERETIKTRVKVEHKLNLVFEPLIRVFIDSRTRF